MTDAPVTSTATTPAPVVSSAAAPATIVSVIDSDVSHVESDVESVWTKVKPYVLIVAGAVVGYVVRSLI